MTDIAEQVRGLRNNRENLATDPPSYQVGFEDALQAAADLIASSPELAEMRRDAERYRWLATVPNWLDDAVMENFDIEPLSKATLDAAIDAQLGEGT